MNNRGQATLASSLNILSGVWLVIAPFVLGYQSQTALWNDVILGVIVGSIGIIRTFSPSRSTTWLSWSNFVLGLWLIIAPFILGYARTTPRTNDVILGVIVAGLSLWSAGSTSVSPRQTAGV